MTSQVSFATLKNLEKIISLWGANRSTLGLMPQDAFIEAIKKHWIVVYSYDDTILGYLKFRYTNRTQTIAIVHLCVDKLHREKGIAVKLLDFLVNKYKANARGIKLNCRSDYTEATKFWIKYNFQPSGKLPSRGNNPNVHLNVWWFTFGKEDLFSYVPNDKTKAVLDFNIIAKLRDITTNNNTLNEVGQLLNDWHAGELELYRTSETKSEIFRDKDAERANRSEEYIKRFPELNIDKSSVNNLELELRSRFTGASENDRSDRRQLAEAILSGFPYFVTLDEGIIGHKDYLFSTYLIKIVKPTELITEIDILNNAADYYPSKLSGSMFTICKVSNEDRKCVEIDFLNYGLGEKKSSLSKKIDGILNSNASKLKTIKEGENHVALIGTNENDETLTVSLLRTKQYAMRQTIFMQNVTDLINYSANTGKKYIQIIDEYLTENEKSILSNYGFYINDDKYIRGIKNQLSTVSDLKENLQDLLNRIPQLEPYITNLSQPKSADQISLSCYYLEKQLWPLKLTDADIPCYIIPIKANYARQLFDTKAAKQDMFGVQPSLIWNKENVYYRNINPNIETFPARILWYISADKNSCRQKAIVCSSYLDEVIVDTAKDLYKKYQRFGVYSWEKHIKPLAKYNATGKIKVLRFSDSEPFKTPISYLKAKEILKKNNESDNNFQSPKLIKKDTFIEIYRLGKGL